MTDDYGLLNPKAEQSAAVDLMECPFCGGIPKYSKEGTEHPWMVSVVRCKCGVSLGCSGHGAAELWNTRQTDSLSHRCGFNAGVAFAKHTAEQAQPLTELATKYRNSLNRIRDIVCFHWGNNGDKVDAIRKALDDAPSFDEYHKALTTGGE